MSQVPMDSSSLAMESGNPNRALTTPLPDFGFGESDHLAQAGYPLTVPTSSHQGPGLDPGDPGLNPNWDSGADTDNANVGAQEEPRHLGHEASTIHHEPISLSLPPGYLFSASPYGDYPSDPSNPFDSAFPRGLLYHIVDLFFEFIYPLVPCIHRPTFMRDLHAKREENPDEEEWIALVFSVVAITLGQLPRALVSKSRKEVKAMVLKCYGMARRYLIKDFEICTVSRRECAVVKQLLT